MNLQDTLADAFVSALEFRKIKAEKLNKLPVPTLIKGSVCIFQLENVEAFRRWQETIIECGNQANRIVLIVPDISIVVEDIDLIEIIIPEPVEAKKIDELLDTLYLKEEELEILSILLLEENPVSSRVSYRILESLGYDVFIAKGDEKLWDYLLNEKYDLILADLSMPIMSGAKQLKKFRSLGLKTPIIGLSSVGSQKQELLKTNGIDGLLERPFEASDVLEEFNRVLSLEERGERINKAVEDRGLFYPEELKKLIGNSKDLIEDLLRHFMKDTEERLFRLDILKKEENKEGLIRTFHSIAGASKTLRAPDFGNRCSALEKIYKENMESELPVDILERDMRTVYIETRKKMRDFLNSL